MCKVVALLRCLLVLTSRKLHNHLRNILLGARLHVYDIQFDVASL